MAADVQKDPEDNSPHWFIGAWRPAAGWVGVFTLLYSGIGISLFSWIGAIFGFPPLPIVDPTATTNILYGMLGIGSMRTVEKVRSVATKGIKK